MANSILNLAKTPQFWWFTGHGMAIFCFVVYSVSALFGSYALSWYNYCLHAIIFTYIIVLRQTYANRSMIQVLSRYQLLLADDNVQYLSLAVLLRLSSRFPGPLPTGLYPFVIFAAFHALSYIKSFIIPQVSFLSAEAKKHYISIISNFILHYNESSLYVASSFEFYLLLPVLMRLAKLVIFFEWLRSNPFSTMKKLLVNLSIIVFVKLRYNQSKHMKQIVANYDLRANQILYASPYIPPQLQAYYQAARQMVITYIGPIKLPSPKKN